MINAYHLTYGDIVKYHGDYFAFLGIHRRYDSKTSELLETYAIYEGAYGIKAEIEDSSIEEVPLTEELLREIGFTIYPLSENCYKAYNGDSAKSNASIYADHKGMDLTVTGEDSHGYYDDIHFLHELQEAERAHGLYNKANIPWYNLKNRHF